MMHDKKVNTVILNDCIFTHIESEEDGYVVLSRTIPDEIFPFKSCILKKMGDNLTIAETSLFHVYSQSNLHAVMNHVALIKMALEYSYYHWNHELLRSYLPLESLTTMFSNGITLMHENNFNNSFTQKLLASATVI